MFMFIAIVIWVVCNCIGYGTGHGGFKDWD